MPRQQSRKSFKKNRRTYRRRYKRNMLSFNKAPMPNKFAVKLRYAESYSIDPGVGGITGVRVIRANSLNDPDRTGGGHQPRGFDQLMAMYDHFVVIGSKITVMFNTGGTTGIGGAFIVGISLKDSDTTAADKNEYMEGRNVVSRQLLKGAGSATSIVQDRCTLKKTFSARKFLGRSKPLSDPELKGGSGSNPTEQAFFHIFAQLMNSSLDANPIEVQVVIDYLAVLIEPKQPTQS